MNVPGQCRGVLNWRQINPEQGLKGWDIAERWGECSISGAVPRDASLHIERAADTVSVGYDPGGRLATLT